MSGIGTLSGGASSAILTGMLKSLRRDISRLLRRDSRVQAAYLFGSIARGRPDPRDVDVAVLLAARAASHRAGEAVFSLQASLEDRLGRPVDVILLNEADPFLRFQVYSKGLVLFERRPREAHDFQIQAVQEFWDMLPFLAASKSRAFRRLGVRHAG